MSIPDFDVEPPVGPRFWPRVLGVVSAVTGVLAVIGWPLPIVSGRTERAHAWERTVQGVQDWLAFDGWRLSGASWVYGAASIAALTGAITLLRPEWSSARKFVVVVAPTGTLLVVGPAVQWAAGLPWSNYGQGSTGGIALGILAASVGGAVVVGFRALIPRSVQPEDDVNPPPRGVR